MSFTIGDFSLRALTIGLRWIRVNRDFPEKLDDWTQEQADCLEKICQIIDERLLSRGL